jgi:hypothetical protein
MDFDDCISQTFVFFHHKVWAVALLSRIQALLSSAHDNHRERDDAFAGYLTLRITHFLTLRLQRDQKLTFLFPSAASDGRYCES